jgi:hypothetical protein
MPHHAHEHGWDDVAMSDSRFILCTYRMVINNTLAEMESHEMNKHLDDH